jgi:hypothetical protein
MAHAIRSISRRTMVAAPALVALLLLGACGRDRTEVNEPAAAEAPVAAAAEAPVAAAAEATTAPAVEAPAAEAPAAAPAPVEEAAAPQPESPLQSESPLQPPSPLATESAAAGASETQASAGLPAPTLTPLPAATFTPQGGFGEWWSSDPDLQEALGLARNESAFELQIAYQPFERGLMIWRADDQRIYALLQDGTWESYRDTFVEGEPERDPTLSSPGELLQPVRGFGKIWREDETLQQRIGWGTDEEGPARASVQHFENGFILRINARTFAIYDAGEGNVWVERR